MKDCEKTNFDDRRPLQEDFGGKVLEDYVAEKLADADDQRRVLASHRPAKTTQRAFTRAGTGNRMYICEVSVQNCMTEQFNLHRIIVQKS